MFQDFTDPPAGATDARIDTLRAQMAAHDCDAYLVPRADEFQGEYVPACAERLFWLTGFSGSAGQVVITRDRAALIVDGRYTVQAAMQVNTDIFEIVQQPPGSLTDWTSSALRKTKNAKLGFDPWTLTIAQVQQLEDKLSEAAVTLQPVKSNLVDDLWSDRPPPPHSTIRSHPLKFAGVSAAEKLDRLRDTLKAAKQDVMVITLPETTSWLFNIRAQDVPHTPVVRAYAIVPCRGRATIFADPARVSPQATRSLDKVAHFAPPEAFPAALDSLKEKGRQVRVAKAHTPFAITQHLQADQMDEAIDPTIAWKAVKNDTEIEGARTAHHRDAIAVCRFLAWLDRSAPSGETTEISAATKLEDCRRDTNQLEEISFDTISGFGPNGAIVHYRVTRATDRTLKGNGLYLVDSGAQYLDGTTDITRTVAIGTPTRTMKQAFTRVLKGHIAIATARFPVGTRGIDLDVLARSSLWQAGLDYDHGTGHGVGSYLSVHEGPQGIHRRSMVALEPGMILSNEPGYYREKAFGIRIENLVLVSPPETPKGGDRPMLSFETLTRAPIDQRLVDADLLTRAERDWLNAYHAQVKREIAPELDKTDRAWLAGACKPV